MQIAVRQGIFVRSEARTAGEQILSLFTKRLLLFNGLGEDDLASRPVLRKEVRRFQPDQDETFEDNGRLCNRLPSAVCPHRYTYSAARKIATET